ncbi:MAG TPA: VOC family protein [Candidatus Dormibacteraeota bacterium]|nr:VOC family protein [Candidatus Dormibacteraeota bacterium]
MAKHVISQLAHVELYSVDPEGSLRFFRDVLGMEEAGRERQSVHLRAWGEHHRSSLTITEAARPGLGHVGWRSNGPEELELAVADLKASGLGEGWIDGAFGHGPAYRFRTPDGHPNEVFWEWERYRAPEGAWSRIRNHPQRLSGRGAMVRRIDHVNLFCQDVPGARALFQERLGFKYNEMLTTLDGQEVGAFLACSSLSHDLGLIQDASGGVGRLNHVAYWLDTREDVIRAADLLVDAGFELEHGPTRHAISEAFFVYVFEPGGNRVEVYSGGYLNFAPDWGPIRWSFADNPILYWGGQPPETMTAKSWGSPPTPEQEEASRRPGPTAGTGYAAGPPPEALPHS